MRIGEEGRGEVLRSFTTDADTLTLALSLRERELGAVQRFTCGVNGFSGQRTQKINCPLVGTVIGTKDKATQICHADVFKPFDLS